MAGRSRALASPALWLVVAVGLAAACGPTAPPNVVLITLDTTRADHVGVYGYGRDTTPQLDRFAERATVYEHAYTTSSWTLPSHASIFTGLLPGEHGAGDLARRGADQEFQPLGDEFVTLAELLRDAGYRSAGVIGGAALDSELGVGQGFESYDDDFSQPLVKYSGRPAKWVADTAIEHLERFGDEPYFLFVNFFDPHLPHTAPGAERPPVELMKQVTQSVLERLGRPPVSVDALEAWEVKALRASLAAYDAEIRYMDEHLGRLLAAVEASPRGPETLILITSDHGESFGEHYTFLHGLHLYEDNVRAVLVVRSPGQRTGKRVTRPVQNHQIFATVLAAAGVPAPESIHVHPLEESEDPLVMEVQRTWLALNILGPRANRDLRALYDAPYKLIVSSTGALELYDLERDPEELENLAESQPEIVARLRERLDRNRRERPPLYGERSPAEIDADTRDALRELGYLE